MANLGRAYRRTSGLLTFLLLCTAGAATAAPGETRDKDVPKVSTSDEKPALSVNRLLGRRVGNFTATDAASGKPVSLYTYRGNLAVVLVFLGNECPVGDLYAPRLAELAKEFGPKKVVFLGVNSNAHETAEQVAVYAKGHGLTFPVLKDDRNVVADAVMAERTCEVIVLDGMAQVRYRGAIDDQYGVGTRKDAPAHRYLHDALTEVVTGGRVEALPA